MSTRDGIDKLKFPSGLSVRQAKANAKDLKARLGIKLYEAQQIVSADNGLDLPWDQAIDSLRALSTKGESKRDSLIPTKACAAILRIELFGVSDVIESWFYNLPHIPECINEVIGKGRKYHLVLHNFRNELVDKPRIKLTLDLRGCNSDSEKRILNNAAFLNAFKFISGFSNKVKSAVLLSSSVLTNHSGALTLAQQSIDDFFSNWQQIKLVSPDLSMKLFSVYAIKQNVDAAVSTRVIVSRTRQGFKFDIAGSDSLVITSEAFLTLATIGTRFEATDDRYNFYTPVEQDIGILNTCGAVKLAGEASNAECFELTNVGYLLIRECMDIYHELQMGRVAFRTGEQRFHSSEYNESLESDVEWSQKFHSMPVTGNCDSGCGKPAKVWFGYTSCATCGDASCISIQTNRYEGNN